MGILINITGGRNMTLKELNAAASYVSSLAHEDANIIMGSVINEALGDTIKVTVIATGFESHVRRSHAPGAGTRLADRIHHRTAAPTRTPSSPPARDQWESSPSYEPTTLSDGVRHSRKVSLEEAAGGYARVKPENIASFASSTGREADGVEDEYDVPAFQRMQPRS